MALTMSVAAPDATPWRRARVAAMHPASLVLAVTALTAWLVVAGAADLQNAAILLLVSPAIEEAAFRAGLHDALLRHGFGGIASNLLTALVFAAAHVAWRSDEALAAAVVLPALAIGWIYGRYRSVRLCVAAHMIMNIAWLLLGPR